jgi:hypothetical protein
MTDYLLAMYYSQAESAVPDNIDEIMTRVAAYNDRLRAADALVWTGGLEFTNAARVVRAGEPPLITDGPYLETNEAMGGFWIIRANTLEAAEQWAADASVATGLAIEVRAFQR